MTPTAQFIAAGEALYGPEWRRKLGDALGVNERQIRRWAKGEYDLPQGVWDDLAFICEKKARELTLIAKSLPLAE